jgi:hypothetical protein
MKNRERSPLRRRPRALLPDQGRVSEAQTDTIYGSESNCKRFAKSAFFKRHVVRKTVEPGGRVKVPTAKGSYGKVMAGWQ